MTQKVMRARAEEIAEYEQWMHDFAENAFSYDMKHPEVEALSRTTSTRMGSFLMWKLLTKGKLD